MKTLLTVLNIGRRSLSDDSRESMEAAAERWGCDFRVVVDDAFPGRCSWWNKFVNLDPGYDLVLQLDADMTVWDQAPSPFDVADPEKLSVVREWQPEFGKVPGQARWLSHNADNSYVHAVGWWALRLDLKPCPLKAYANGGFLLFDPTRAKPWFDEILAAAPLCDFNGHAWSDQTVVSLLGYNGVIPLNFMDSRFNAMHAGTASALLGPGHDGVYIKHFCGAQATRQQRMASSSWRSRDPQPPRLPDV